MAAYFGWGAFAVFVIAMMAIDLGFHRRAHEIKIREALLWTAFWISLAMLFCFGIYYFRGQDKALEFLAGYLIEESLSVDNLFVFLMIFIYFKVPSLHQNKVLFWGILLALVLRAVFIAVGIALVNRFHWVLYIFGAFLIYTAFKMATGEDHDIHPDQNPLLRLLRRVMPVTDHYESGNFFTRFNGVLQATPLFAVMIVIAPTDVMFAVDSIPAILAVTTDPFIVYTSNVFALMGLRSIFFALAGLMRIFHYLRHGLVVVLTFVGIKMLIQDWMKIPIGWSLGVIAAVLAISMAASTIFTRKVEQVLSPESEKSDTR